MVLRDTKVYKDRLRTDPASAVSARHPCDVTWNGLPLLTQLCGNCGAVQCAEHPDLNELPYSSAKRQSEAGAGACELENGQPSGMGVDLSHRRLRLLQSRGAREPRHQLRQLSRPRQSYVDGVSGQAAQHGVVPRMPSASRKFPATRRSGFQSRLETGRCETSGICGEVRTAA